MRVCIDRERARDRHLLALKEEMVNRQTKKGEKERQVERLKFTRETEGKRSREIASQSSSQHPLIMVSHLVLYYYND